MKGLEYVGRRFLLHEAPHPQQVGRRILDAGFPEEGGVDTTRVEYDPIRASSQSLELTDHVS